MKNISYIRKKAFSIFLAAAILMAGNSMESLAAEIDQMTVQVQETELPKDLEQNENLVEKRPLQQEENVNINIGTGNNELAEYTEIASDSAIHVATSGSLQVEPLSIEVVAEKYKIGGKQIKLNFSYELLGCVKVDSHLNVRKERNTDAEIAGKLSNNTFCDILGIYNDGWAKIKSGKIKGYVSADYLLIGEKAQEVALKKAKKTVKVKTSRLNVRSLPSIKTRTYGQIRRKSEITVKSEQVTKKQVKKLLRKNKSLRRQLNASNRRNMLEASNLEQWICVKYNGKKAFVSKDYAKVIYTVKIGSEEKEEVNTINKKVVKYAKKFLGNRYVYGGSSLKHGTDCSGFIMKVYQHFGYRLARSSAAQSKNGRKVKGSKLQLGDLLFYKKRGRISHVSMYIGDGKVIHASNEKNGIIISNVGYRRACRYVRILKG